ncbi:MAG TPA: hypothetical protein VEH27_19350 [Methylomirabilota bacterium]|nr:hypothetical protein [Methylomirabilota bacterium]
MPRQKKTWSEKLNDPKDLPKVVALEGSKFQRWGKGTCAIPAPREVNELMAQVPKGRLVTINALREALARKHHADIGCPITTGIFAWISAHAAEEQGASGAKKITPWWRTLKTGGELNPKFPGGLDEQRRRLEAEGHKIEQRGKRWLVANHEAALHQF